MNRKTRRHARALRLTGRNPLIHNRVAGYKARRRRKVRALRVELRRAVQARDFVRAAALRLRIRLTGADLYRSYAQQLELWALYNASALSKARSRARFAAGGFTTPGKYQPAGIVHPGSCHFPPLVKIDEIQNLGLLEMIVKPGQGGRIIATGSPDRRGTPFHEVWARKPVPRQEVFDTWTDDEEPAA